MDAEEELIRQLKDQIELSSLKKNKQITKERVRVRQSNGEY